MLFIFVYLHACFHQDYYYFVTRFQMFFVGLCAFLLGLCVEHNKDDNEKFDKQSLRAIVDKRIGKWAEKF